MLSIDKLNQIREKIDSITDRLGCPIDPLIKESVIVFMLCGFNTAASCQGHLDHGESYPWIDIDNELWNDQGSEENIKQLNKFQDMLNEYNSMPDTDNTDIRIQYFGIFNAFRIYSSSIEKMNKFCYFLQNTCWSK